jgi:hypothetical protein
MSATLSTSSISPRHASKIELAVDLSIVDLAIWSGISRNKLSIHLRDAVDPLPSYNYGRKHMINKQEYLAWRTRRFSTLAPDPAIVAPRRRRRKSRAM